jgi:hypothetical protein
MDDEHSHAERIPVRELKSEPESEALMRSAAMKPYLDLLIAAMSGKDAGTEMDALAALPLEKRYVWRVASALKWAFADLETASVEADCQTLSEADQGRLVEVLKLRPLQFCLFLSALIGPDQMEELMLEAIRTARTMNAPPFVGTGIA